MPQANQRVGEYILDQKLGAGGFGEVWRARHHVWTDRLVAIKVPTDPQYLRSLQQEGAAIHGLQHVNIVRAIGFDPYAPVPYLTMEYVPGTSLRTPIESKSLTWEDAVAILRQVLAGLTHAHAAGIVHRDIKPENILIHQRAQAEGYGAIGAVKVTDFGLGAAASTTAMARGSIALSMSLDSPDARRLAGTLDYMAPEQRHGDGAVDGRADLYACGVVLYEMLTGERPAGTEVPSDIVPGVPAWLDGAFRQSYARLDKRFASAEEFLAALTRHSPPPLPGAARRSVPHTACPNCRQSVGRDDQFCMACGIQLVAAPRRCGHCGAYPDVHDEYCIFCGHAVNGRAAVAT